MCCWTRLLRMGLQSHSGIPKTRTGPWLGRCHQKWTGQRAQESKAGSWRAVREGYLDIAKQDREAREREKGSLIRPERLNSSDGGWIGVGSALVIRSSWRQGL